MHTPLEHIPICEPVIKEDGLYASFERKNIAEEIELSYLLDLLYGPQVWPYLKSVLIYRGYIMP